MPENFVVCYWCGECTPINGLICRYCSRTEFSEGSIEGHQHYETKPCWAGCA